jgi:signal transduction histidine kinase
MPRPLARHAPWIEPFVLIELMVFVTAESANIVEDTPHAVPWWATAICIALFSAIRLRLPAREAPLRPKVFFVACEVAILIATAAGTMNPALIILTIALMLRNTELFDPKTSYLLGAGVLAVVLTALALWSRGGGISWTVIASWLITLTLSTVMAGVLTSVAASERISAVRLRAAYEDLRKYAASAADVAAVQERARIAADLHDAVGHALTALNIQLESAIRLRASDPGSADALLDSAKALGSEALTSVRATVARLRADPLERETLDVVLERVCGRFERDFGMTIRCTLSPLRNDPAVTTTIARITEEALVNVVRHAGSRNVRVCLRRDAEHAALEIEDDGVGFLTEDNASGHGLQIMRERAQASAIDIAVRSKPGAGTTIALSWRAA